MISCEAAKPHDTRKKSRKKHRAFNGVTRFCGSALDMTRTGLARPLVVFDGDAGLFTTWLRLKSDDESPPLERCMN